MSLDPLNLERIELREENRNAWLGDVYVPGGKLDSSIKKNHAFIRKIKTSFNGENYENALKDIRTLSLEKYLGEVLRSIEESLLSIRKSDEIMAFIRIVSLLHQRFPGQVTPRILSHLVNEIVQSDKSENKAAIRNALRLVFEMYVVGLCETFNQCDRASLREDAHKFHDKLGESVVAVPLLKDVMSYQPKTGVSLSIVVPFLKRYGFILDLEQDLISPELQKQLLELFVLYASKQIEVLKLLHSNLLKLIKQDKKVSIRTGRLLEEIQEEIQEKTETKAAIITQLSTLCELLNLEMPILEDNEPAPEEEVVVVEESSNGWWEDAKEKSFYKEIPLIQDVVSDTNVAVLPEADLAELRDADKINLFLQKLEDVGSEAEVRSLVKIFMTQMPHNKATNHRLLRYFAAVPKVDNVNYYARFLTITKEMYPEMINELAETLDHGFRSQIYHGSISFRNLYFFIELIKFGLIPLYVVFHKIRKMTLNLSSKSNCDILLIFYERCGKFLHYEPSYRETTKEMLELLHQQAKSEKLSINDKLSLRNTFLIVESFTSPKQVETQKVIEQTPLEDFISQLLQKPTILKEEQVAEILQKFARKTEAQSVILQIFLKPEEISLDRLRFLAKVLRRLGPEFTNLALQILDTLVENVIRGLELNDYRHNVARIAHIKLLAALCDTNAVAMKCAFDLMFKILCYGHPNNMPFPNSPLALDTPDDYFRIRLVCTFLNSITMSKLSNADMFGNGTQCVEGIIFFLQYYIFCKQLPVPRDVQFFIEDSFRAYDLRARHPFERAYDIRSAILSLQRYTSDSTTLESTAEDQADENDKDAFDAGISDDDDDTLTEDEESEEETEDESVAEEENGENELENDSDFDSSEESDVLDDEEFENDEIAQQREEELKAREEERKFAQTLDSGIRELMNDSAGHSRSTVSLKVPAPSSILPIDPNRQDGPTKFKLLSKNNQFKELSLPANSQLAQRIQQEQAAQRANRAKILSLINNMDTT